MPRHAPSIVLTPEERQSLVSLARAGTTKQRDHFRARVILLAADGLRNDQIAARLDTQAMTVAKWRNRFISQRLAGLADEPRPGKKPLYTPETERRILDKLNDPPPEGWAVWNGRLVAEALGDVSDDYVWRVMRKHGISLEKRRSWCVSTDPEFATKAADIVALYLAPPENALVICVDEKPSIQALERAQGYLQMPNGKALLGFSHDYKRHGTTTLFAALNIVSGEVQTGHYNRRRRREFLDFMNEVIAGIDPAKQVHVILDNLNTHKPKNDQWLARHKNVHFHFTPTHASWLNQVEVWFSILSRGALRGASFTSPKQVRQAIDRFTTVYNATAAPFEWRKEQVGPKTMKNNLTK